MLLRSIRPPDYDDSDIVPNPNDPAANPPASVGPDQLVNPGDPDGVEFPVAGTTSHLPAIVPSLWSGYPSSWYPPLWNSHAESLTDTAWTCIDLNASLLATMPPYLVDAAPTLDAGWLVNPEPTLYASWCEFAKELFWSYQAAGEAFVLATSFYSTGWPATFHVLPPYLVEVDMDNGLRRYRVGPTELSPNELLHLRYQSSTADAHGHGPLEAGRTKVIAGEILGRYIYGLASSGGIPTSVLTHPDLLSPEQSAQLKADWIAARQSAIGEPAVLSGGIKWEATQVNPKDMALVEITQMNDSKIAVLLGVPPFLVGLPSGGDSLTYSTTVQLFDFHWRSGLRPKATAVMAALSGWLLPRGTTVEVNQDSYIQPGPYERAQTAEIYSRIVDAATGQPVMSVAEIREAERLDDRTTDIVSAPVVPVP